MNDKKGKTLIGSGIGLGAIGALLTMISPCCTLPAIFALLAGLGLSATAIHFSGSLFLGVGVLLLSIGVILFIKTRNKDKDPCSTSCSTKK